MAALQRLMADAKQVWSSLMVSKLDEAHSPWNLLQHLMNAQNSVGLSVSSASEKITEDLLPLDVTTLVKLAIEPLKSVNCMNPIAEQPTPLAYTEFH